MRKYIGTKIINAKEMNRADYNELRGWHLPVDENSSDEGYLIEDINLKSNISEYSSFLSFGLAEDWYIV